MNMHSRLNSEDRQSAPQATQAPSSQPAKTGLWRLLAAAAAILVGLALAIEFLSDDASDFRGNATQEATQP